MHILMLNNEFPPLGGGMGTVNRALLEHLAGRPDIEIDLITAALGGRSGFEQFADRIRIFKVPVWNQNLHHSTNRELSMYATQALPLALKQHLNRPYDFCFAWSTVPAGGVALALRRLVSLPYLVWVSGPDIPGFERRYRWLYPLLTPLIRTVWSQAQVVIAKCEDEVKMIQRVKPDLRVTLIPNGVDLTNFQPGPPIPDEGPLQILCSGRLIERKGQHHLIEAVKKLTGEGVDITLTLLGTGDSLPIYQNLTRRLGLTDRVHFLGYIPRDKIKAYYTAAHVFALASYNEGMSLATLEAMASGLPIVVTRNGTAEIIDEGVNGFLFDWADVDVLATHLKRLAQDRALARRMGGASQRRAGEFAWESIVDQYLMLFTRLVPNGSYNSPFTLSQTVSD